MKQHGFTLIELVIIIIVVAAISIAAVSVNWTAAPKLKAFANQVAAHIRYVQNLANTRDKAYRINFLSSQIYLTETNGTTAVNFPSSNSPSLALPSGFSWSFSGLRNQYIVYNQDGEPYYDVDQTLPMTANLVITINHDGMSKTVTVSGVSGTVLKVS